MLSVVERYPLPEIPKIEVRPPSDEFGPEILDKVEEMEYTIECLIANREFAPRLLAFIPNQTNRGKGIVNTYVEHMAVHELLYRKGLLDQFYDDEATYREGNNRWNVIMERRLPGSRYTEQYTFVSTDQEGAESGATHTFMLRYHLLQR